MVNEIYRMARHQDSLQNLVTFGVGQVCRLFCSQILVEHLYRRQASSYKCSHKRKINGVCLRCQISGDIVK